MSVPMPVQFILLKIETNVTKQSFYKKKENTVHKSQCETLYNEGKCLDETAQTPSF